jgi:SpoVK/Ycf46/Vps4 family AAA+-type ATPase
VFRKAAAAAPSIIFFDEFDSMAKRDTGHDSLSPVTALLTEMDGFEKKTGVMVLAATNQPWTVDDALLRPGRFDYKFYVGLPNTDAREQILEIKTQGRPLNADVDLQDLARRTEGWSGAEVTEMCELAIRKALEHLVSSATAEENVEILPEYFEAAFSSINPGISEEMLQKFEEWSLTHSVQRSD